MFCTKCGKELPEGSQFCLQCGRPLTADTIAYASLRPERKRPAVSVLGIVAIVLLVVLAFMLWNWTQSVGPRLASRPPASYNPLAPALVPMSSKLFTGQIVVKAGSYIRNTFTVEPGMQSFHVVGHFNASGGTGNDIQVVLADEGEFQNWINGHQARVFYSTDKITDGKMDVGPLAPGRYVMAFSNKFSVFADKYVFAEIEADWMAQR